MITIKNYCQTRIDTVIHFVHNLMVDRTMTATLMEGSDYPRGQNSCKIIQNHDQTKNVWEKVIPNRF